MFKDQISGIKRCHYQIAMYLSWLELHLNLSLSLCFTEKMKPLVSELSAQYMNIHKTLSYSQMMKFRGPDLPKHICHASCTWCTSLGTKKNFTGEDNHNLADSSKSCDPVVLMTCRLLAEVNLNVPWDLILNPNSCTSCLALHAWQEVWL